jgi:carbon storage regulator
MLVLTRKVNERIVCSNGMVITVLAINGSSVRIGIKAPPDVTILRSELCHPTRGRAEKANESHSHNLRTR